MSEGTTLRACRDYLSVAGLFHFRCNTQGVPIAGQPGKFRPAPSRGVSDIIAVHGGRAIAIEVKSKVGRQSPAQLEFQAEWERAGGMYLLVRSVDELRDGLRKGGISAK